MVALSVIVPVYNVERYLSECIDSLIAQCFQDFELLLIDDGSLDNSGLICDKYAEQNKRIRVFHKKNEGVSSARNYGIEHASGKWITFVDADDFVGIDFLKGLYYPIFNGLIVDFVHGGCSNFWNGKSVTVNQSYDYYVGNDKGKLFSSFRGLAVSKLFKTEIIRENGLMFDDNMKIAEDMAFTMDYLHYVDSYAFVETTCYYYRQDNDNSATHTNNHLSYSIARKGFIHLFESTVSYVNQFGLSSEESQLRFEQRAEQYLRVLKSMYYDKSFNRKKRVSLLESESRTVYFDLLSYVLPSSRFYRESQLLIKKRFLRYDFYQYIYVMVSLSKQRVSRLLASFREFWEQQTKNTHTF